VPGQPPPPPPGQPRREIGPVLLRRRDGAAAQGLLEQLAARSLDGGLVGETLVQDGGRAPEIDLRREGQPLELFGGQIRELAPERGPGVSVLAQSAPLAVAESARLLPTH